MRLQSHCIFLLCRLSRERRVVENSFGILVMRFLCLLDCLNQSPETIDFIILVYTCITLHNLFRIRNPYIASQTIDHEDAYNELQPGEWRQGKQLTDGDHTHGRNAVTSACVRQRDYLLKTLFEFHSRFSRLARKYDVVQQYNYTDTCSFTVKPQMYLFK